MRVIVDPVWIRAEFQLPETVSDEEILNTAETLQGRCIEDLRIFTGNYLEWRDLSKDYSIHIGEELRLRLPVYSLECFSGLYFAETIMAFVEAHYGPALVWARATLERLLQEESMRFPELRNHIEREGRNPSISRMSEVLEKADGWSREESRAVDTIETNGNWVVHHRIDQFAKGKRPEDYRLGVARVQITIEGLKVLGPDLLATVERNLRDEYRRRCVESLRALCVLFQRYRPSEQR